MKFGSCSVDAILVGQFGGRRPQLVGYGTPPLTILSPLLEAGTDFIDCDCECPAFAAHCIPPHRHNRPKNDVNSYARRISCGLTESSRSSSPSPYQTLDNRLDIG